MKITEVPGFELERRPGTSNLHAFRLGKRVLGSLLRERSSANPRQIAIPGSIGLLQQVKPTGLVVQVFSEGEA